MRPARCPLLVGRAADLELVRARVEAAAAGQGSTVFVLGEPGVGKSRLAAAGAEVAGASGMQVLRGRAAPSPAPVPYRPLTEALLCSLRGRAARAPEELAPLGSALSVLVPGWAGDGTERPAEPSVVLLGETALSLLRSIAGDGGALVVLEDLHWSDPGTLELLDYLADKLEGTAVVLVATARTGEGCGAERLARQLEARGHSEVLELQRLPPGEVATMVAAVLEAPAPPPAVVATVERLSDGLPFLVEEVLASLFATGSVVRDGEGWRVEGPLDPAVPASVAALVAERLALLSPASLAIVQAAAVLGEFDWQLVERTCGCGRDQLFLALREATALQLVEEDRADRVVRFRHALTRMAVLDTLLLPERVGVARAALAALEQDSDARSDPASLALAAELAETAGERRRAGELLVASAQAALERGAVSAAVLAAERVVAGAADHDQVVRGLELLLDGFLMAGDVRRVVDIGERLLGRLEAGGAPVGRRAAAHLRLAGAAMAATDWRRASDHLAAMESLVPSAGGELGARRDLVKAHVALGGHDVDTALAHAEAAHRVATALGDQDMACESLELLGRVARVRDWSQARDHFTRAMVLAEAADLRWRRVRALHELGTLELLRLAPPVQLRAAHDAAEAIGAPGLAAQAGLHLAVAHFVRFEIEQAREAIERTVAGAERYQLGLLVPAATTVSGALDAVQGHRAAAAATFERVAPLMDAEVEATGRGHVLALAALADEDRDAALAEMAAAERLCPPGSGVSRAPFRGLHDLLLSLDPAAPTELHSALRAETASLHLATWALFELAGAVRDGRGDGRGGAEQRAETAFGVLSEAPWYLAVSRRLVAEAALADGWGRPDVWLREALEFFAKAELEAPARACRSLLRRCGATVPRPPRESAMNPALARLGVTPREADVLALVADGLSNKDIAGRLYLSARTVEKHVERLLVKTGTSNRTQLSVVASDLRR